MRNPQIANVNLDAIAPLPAPLLAAAIAVVAVIIVTAAAIVTAVMLPNPLALRSNAPINQKQSKTHHRNQNSNKRSVEINNVKLAAWKVRCKSSVPNGIVPIEEAAMLNGTIPAKTQQNKRVNKVAVALAVVSVSGSVRENVNGIEIEIERGSVIVSVTIKCDVDVNGIGNESGNGNAAGKDGRSNEIEATNVGIDHVDLPISGDAVEVAVAVHEIVLIEVEVVAEAEAEEDNVGRISSRTVATGTRRMSTLSGANQATIKTKPKTSHKMMSLWIRRNLTLV